MKQKTWNNIYRSILTQDYPDYEVILVNDCSTDDTDMVMKRYLAKYPG